jgi:hypothetical protein
VCVCACCESVRYAHAHGEALAMFDDTAQPRPASATLSVYGVVSAGASAYESVDAPLAPRGNGGMCTRARALFLLGVSRASRADTPAPRRDD